MSLPGYDESPYYDGDAESDDADDGYSDAVAADPMALGADAPELEPGPAGARRARRVGRPARRGAAVSAHTPGPWEAMGWRAAIARAEGRVGAVVMLLAAALAFSACVRLTPHPSLPVFSPASRLLELSTEEARANASAHVAWSVALPLAGLAVGGHRGLRWSAAGWLVGSLLQEALWHAPDHPGLDYPAEVRIDLLTRLVPAAALLVVDLLTAEVPRG